MSMHVCVCVCVSLYMVVCLCVYACLRVCIEKRDSPSDCSNSSYQAESLYESHGQHHEVNNTVYSTRVTCASWSL